jgi:hypothetical protein
MIVTVLFYLFTLINILAVKDVYWPLLKNHVDAFIALHTITRSWQTAILCAVFFLKTIARAVYKEKITKVKQWWHKTATPLGNDRFLLVHYIDGDKIKLIVKKREDEVRAVVDESYDECYLEEAKPFLLYEQEEFGPETLGLDKALIIHTEGGEQLKRDMKTASRTTKLD